MSRGRCCFRFKPEALVNGWSELGSSLYGLSNLRKLRIWLDHDSQDSWAVVDEQVALSYLCQLSEAPYLDILLSLPKLHPKLEKEELHLTQTESLCFTIHRRVRQRYFGDVSEEGADKMVCKPDFPFLLIAVEFVDMKMAEIEEKERCMWEMGIDVKEMMHEVLALPGSIVI